MSNTLQPHGLQHARLFCPSPIPTACSNSCPSSEWCHSTISSSVVSFFSCLQPFPASESFPVSQFFISGAQSIRVSASASVLPMNIQDLFLLELTGLISLPSKRLSETSPTPHFKSINSSVLCVFGKGCLIWPVYSLGKALLAFDLLYFVLHGQICLLFACYSGYLLTSYPCIPVSYNEKDIFFWY